MDNAGWLIAEKALRWTLGFFIGAWVARHLGPSDFGQLSATLAWVGIFACVAGFGIEPIVVRELVLRPHENGTILGTAMALRVAGGVFTASAAVIASLAFAKEAPSAILTAIASITTLLSLGETLDLWFQAKMHARLAATARLVAFSLSCGIRIILVLADAPVSLFLWNAAIEALLIFGLLTIQFRRSNPDFKLTWSTRMAQMFLAESWPNIIANLAAMGYLKADRVMLSSMNGEAAAGIYSAATLPVEAWYVLPSALMSSAGPMFARLHENHERKFMHELARIARFQAAMAWILALGLAMGSPWLMPLIYGPDYAKGAAVLATLAFTLPVAFLGLAMSPWYQNTGLTVIAMRRHLFGGILNIGLNYIFIPRLGPTGAAMATLISYIFTHMLANCFDRRTRPLLIIQMRALILLPPPKPCK